MKSTIKAAITLAALAAAAHASSQVVFYEHDNFGGRNFSTDREVRNFDRFGFNDRASSVVVESGRWEVCEQARFGGRCTVLRPGRYASLSAAGLNDRISSVHPIGRDERIADNRYAPVPTPGAQIVFYEHDNFQGASYTTTSNLESLNRVGFNDRVSSVVIDGADWQVCNDTAYRGRCVTLRPGQYPSLASMGLNDRLSSVRMIDDRPAWHDDRPTYGANRGYATLFQRPYFEGPSVQALQPIADFRQSGLNGRAQSLEVVGGRWEVCPNPQFGGQCMLLQPGRYPTLASMGLRGPIASLRAAPDYTVGAVPPRGGRTYEARVTSVRAVVGTPEQRCWVDREQVERGANVPAAIAGALLGGVLGHQVGGGTGKDVATIGGAVAGAAIGSRIGRGDETREVRRCDNNLPSQARAEYWDVTYDFRGLEHRVQMTAPPGATVIVDERGELQG